MMRGGFLGGGNILRSLTLSPMDSMLQQVRQMARRHLETGGPTVSVPKSAKPDLAPRDYILPLDVNPDQVRQAIEAKMGALLKPSDAPPLIERRASGHVVVPGYHILRLGDGRFDLGRRFMHGLIKKLRAGRMRRE